MLCWCHYRAHLPELRATCRRSVTTRGRAPSESFSLCVGGGRVVAPVAVAATAVAAAGHGLTACSALLMFFERMHQLPLTRALSEIQLVPTACRGNSAMSCSALCRSLHGAPPPRRAKVAVVFKGQLAHLKRTHTVEQNNQSHTATECLLKCGSILTGNSIAPYKL